MVEFLNEKNDFINICISTLLNELLIEGIVKWHTENLLVTIVIMLKLVIVYNCIRIT
jgi:hypothetical protein